MSNISRRKFLKTGAAALAGITIAPSTILGMSHGHVSPTDISRIAALAYLFKAPIWQAISSRSLIEAYSASNCFNFFLFSSIRIDIFSF